MVPAMRNSIAGSVDGLCLDAIARNLMTFPERAGILEGGNKFKQASQFLEHFALKIEVSPEVLILFMDILTKLGTCDGVVQKLSKHYVIGDDASAVHINVVNLNLAQDMSTA